MLDILNDLIWSKLLIVMLIGLGLYFTIASRFVQFRYFGSMFRIFAEAFQRQPGQLSSFQALMLSVAGRVGAGNIAGVSVAIMLGGGRDLLDVGRSPGRHGHQLFRVFPGAAVQAP